jgi:group II intron reverse transcriptase/maturase
MHVDGRSDGRVVPVKPPNKGEESSAPAEAAEGRRPTKGNSLEPTADRTQGRVPALNGLQRVREVARRDKEVKFTALLHHMTVDLLADSFYALKRDAAPGVDGLTWKEYEDGLEVRLRDLHRRVHQGTYRAQPSKRTYIPKPDGRQRPLGIAALEDKIVQRATVSVLEPIYESDFLGFSYGFRPGRGAHQALDALWVGLTERKVNWVLDADIQGFFDTLDHGWLMRFLGHRIADRRVHRLVAKWLRAGVSEEGTWRRTSVGTPQGAVASPLLANVYLHYVLDLWVERWRRTQATGDVIIVRYADDFVLGFQHRREAERFLEELRERMKKFGLSLHPDKTRLIEFGRFARENRKARGEGRPETFGFLGFTHMCAETRTNGRFTVQRQTITKRLRATLQAVHEGLKRIWHRTIPEMGQWLRQVVTGYLNYHAVPGNSYAIRAFRSQVSRCWLAVLRRRSQRHTLTWARFRKIIQRWLPPARILHPYPNQRFYAVHPR